jgi:Domain of unknown function (DUF5916)/Carbohydrate family 9 binding domain-like
MRRKLSSTISLPLSGYCRLRRLGRIVAGLAFLLLAMAPGAQGRSEAVPPTVDIPHLLKPLTLRDILTGSAAQQAATVKDFIQRDPHEGEPASQTTAAYLAYDDKNFYVGFLCLDKEPGKIRAHVLPRDSIWNDDHVSVTIDTYNAHHRAVTFSVNPLGIQSDSLFTENYGSDDSFDTLWTSWGKITSRGYAVLMAVPFKTLRFSPQENQTWGMILARSIPRADEYSAWPVLSRSINGRLIQEAQITGLKNISSGKNIQITPYSYFSSSRYLDSETNQFVSEKFHDRLGADAKWVFGTNMTLDATVNPDFSQVESDQPQITVNQRFEVYFPEKRPFFMENSNYFETPIPVVFTRRIADPQFGLRLTGKTGRTTIAALAADDRSPGESVAAGDPAFGHRAYFNVFRFSRDIGRESSLGLIWSDREFLGSYNRVGGVDGRWKISPTTGLDFQALESFSRDLDGNSTQGKGIHVSIDHSAPHWNAWSGYEVLAPNFEVDSGFIDRVDIRSLHGGVGYTFRPKGRWIVAWQPNLHANWLLDHSNVRQDLVTNPGLWVEFAGGTRAYGNYFYKRERYNGLDFLKRQYRLGFGSRASRWFSLNLFYESGQQINYSPADGTNPFLGQGDELEFHLTVQPSERLAVDNTILQNRLLTIENTRNVFNNNVFRSKWNYQFTERLSLRLIGQYTNVLPTSDLSALERSKNLSGDVLLTYLVHPGTALYVGYDNSLDNYNRDLLAQSAVLGRTRNDLLSTGAALFVKFSYLYQF